MPLLVLQRVVVVEVVQPDDAVAAVEQCLGQSTPDEPRGSRHQDRLRCHAPSADAPICRASSVRGSETVPPQLAFSRKALEPERIWCDNRCGPEAKLRNA